MNKITLSTVTIATLALTCANADTSSDIAAMKAMMTEMSQRLAKLETENKQLKSQSKKVKHTKKKKSQSFLPQLRKKNP